MHNIGMIENEYLTVKEFAAKMGLHYNTVVRAIRKGRLNAVRIGYGVKSAYRIPVGEIHRIALCDLEKLVSKLIEEKIK
jgi:excisionase family DNA binding protein